MPRLHAQLPSQGWQQLLTARKELLDAYDQARNKARAHEVPTYHGRVGEAQFRQWLSSFLPKRYGVTSGYVVSPGLDSSAKVPHFDVIIYDQLQAPILWIEDHADVSAHGRSQAVPVEYVLCVLEVKASFNAESVRSAIEHLGDLSPLMQAMDPPHERYKVHLPPQFSCGLVFFELHAKEARSEAALGAVVDGANLRGFFGGLILRAEGHSKPLTGELRLNVFESPRPSDILEAGASLLDFAFSKTMPVDENQHLSASLFWTELAFNEFGFDLIALMNGTFRTNMRSSYYAQGSAQLEEIKTRRNQNKAEVQPIARKAVK